MHKVPGDCGDYLCYVWTRYMKTSSHLVPKNVYGMIYLLIAIGLSPDGSNTHLHTNNA